MALSSKERFMARAKQIPLQLISIQAGSRLQERFQRPGAISWLEVAPMAGWFIVPFKRSKGYPKMVGLQGNIPENPIKTDDGDCG